MDDSTASVSNETKHRSPPEKILPTISVDWAASIWNDSNFVMLLSYWMVNFVEVNYEHFLGIIYA